MWHITPPPLVSKSRRELITLTDMRRITATVCQFNEFLEDYEDNRLCDATPSTSQLSCATATTASRSSTPVDNAPASKKDARNSTVQGREEVKSELNFNSQNSLRLCYQRLLQYIQLSVTVGAFRCALS